MEINEVVKKDVEVIADIICDSCGNSCKTDADFEFIEMKANWGYNTKKDMEKWTAHICEKCVDEKLAFINFKKEQVFFSPFLTTEGERNKQFEQYLLKRKDQ